MFDPVSYVLRSPLIQAMKAVRAELSNEGRYDILERTMPYRGGEEYYFLSFNLRHGSYLSSRQAIHKRYITDAFPFI